MSATCALHPDTPATGVCPRCGTFVCGRCELDAAKHCPACVKLVGASLAVDLPWERREQLGLLTAFWEQTKLGIVKPGLYVASIRPDRPWPEAFFYGWLVTLVVGVLSVPYNAFSFWSQSSQMEDAFGKVGRLPAPLQSVADAFTWLGSHPVLAAVILAGFTVAIYPLTVLVNAALQQVGLVLVGVSARQPIAATLRVGGYSMAPNLLTAIPVVGGFASLYTVVVQVWALREVHRTTTLKAIVAALWFSIALGCCGGFAAVALLAQAVSKLR